MPPTAPMTCVFLGALPAFSIKAAIAPTNAPDSCSLKKSDWTLGSLRSTNLASVPAPSTMAK